MSAYTNDSSPNGRGARGRVPAPHPLSAGIAALLRCGLGAAGGLLLCLPLAARAGCDLHAPAAGQVVTCDAAAPNPDTTAVQAEAGSSGVRVELLPGAALEVAGGAAVSLADASAVANAGRIAASADAVVASGFATVDNAAGGAISSASGHGLNLLGGGRVNNDGDIAAAGTGVLFGGNAASTLVNRGTIAGSVGVAFGTGDDRLDMLGGSISGAVRQDAGADALDLVDGSLDEVDQGEGDDRLVVSGGRIAGGVQQGGGVDDFRMTGGEIGSLLQGDGLDTFFMGDGRIVGAFEDGDSAVMTGGRIGRVNMKLDDNLFDMSGGTIDGNLVTGFGNDTILLSEGYIGGNISVSGGTDRVEITGGTVRGDVLLSFGDDRFLWDGGGIVYGAVELAEDNDSAVLRNLHTGNLGAMPALRGGGGDDSLVLENVLSDGVARFAEWETVDVRGGSQLTFDGTLLLGDAESGTGTLNLAADSTLYGGGQAGGVAAFAAGQLARFNNAGRIDLTNGGGQPGDIFTVAGHYVGDNATVLLNTVLGGDGSASDKLVISGGTASGATGLSVLNAGGAGAATLQDGILVVEAVNGATTAAGAFALYAPVAVGAFEYFLFKGGVSAGSAENWYLRSTLVTTPQPSAPAPAPNSVAPPAAPPQPQPPAALPPDPPAMPPAPPPPEEGATTPPPNQPEPEAPPPPPVPPSAQAPDPAPPAPEVPDEPASLPASPLATPPTPGATPASGEVIPLYRIEAPTYAVVPPVAHELALTALGTFHERQGEQALLTGQGGAPAAWARALGRNTEQSWRGTVAPAFDGTLWGVQLGLDLYAHEAEDGRRDRFGLFLGQARADGDVRGFALGWNNVAVGDMELDDKHVGLYWTRVGARGGYVDAVLLGARYDGEARSGRGLGIDLEGDGLSASLEVGYPIAWRNGGRWALEPQAQLVWQRIDFDDRRDLFSGVAFDSDDALIGRVGLRLAGHYESARGLLQPYLKANLWHGFGGQDRLDFDGNVVVGEQAFNAFEFGGGVVARFNAHFSVYLVGDYTVDLDDAGEDRESVEGNLGMRFAW
ncbi:autotransporter outer membrane beta-barrel domain-containing protein [Vulcaniibacterium tengchongense]|uniref:Outer membrane autotransporter protein n=1 Tax=Vulcaniibacterium tengchongense TaxID=1273429 RepID=A0A3N4VGN6_9GAMM|nr:autotransporter outer membrane beta-barrel domain-containing protein [Vulcaniibacterium tengchongense]RPE81908.1 outer membrane autotransporter protein [Vulcaniibacterium tengchongense]